MKKDDYDDEELQNEEMEEGMEAEGSTDFNLFLQQQMQYLPWWLISIAFHAIILCLAVLIAVDKPPTTVAIEIQTSLETEKVEDFKPELKQPEITREQQPMEQEEPTVSDPVVKDAKVADHSESANEENFQMAKGKMDALTDSPLQGRFDKSEIGVGGRASGAWGGRFGGKENLVKRQGGNKQTEGSVYAGLAWLKRHQGDDGKWSCGGFLQLCGREAEHPGSCGDGGGDASCDVGVTGLALLCFLGAGNSTSIGEFQDQVKKGVQYLRGIQDEDGCIGSKQGNYMYNHAIASLAMAEAYSLSNYNPLLKTPAQKAIDFVVKAQNPNMAWRYQYRCGDNDSSVTGWCVMALKSAKLGGLEFPESCFVGAKAFLDSVTDTTYYRTGYTSKDGFVTPQGYAPNESTTAVGMSARVFMGSERTDPYLIRAAGVLSQCLPSWGNNAKGENMVDFYYWYYGTLAMFQMGGDYWTSWNDKMKEVLVSNQETSGCKKGSWPPTDRWSRQGGRVYATALNVLSLEIYYRYDKVFK